MKLHTLTTRTTDPVERGTTLGRRYGGQVRRVGARYLAHFAALGQPAERVRTIAERSAEALRAWYPTLAIENDAYADAAGVERWVVAALTARTEVLAAVEPAREGECSTAVFVPETGTPETIQTWDWHAALVPEALLHELTPGEGRTVKLFTEFGSPGKIGVNSAGLGVHLNMLSHAADDDTGGVAVHAVARRILDEADTLDEAVSIAGSARFSASTALTVVTAGPEGRGAAVSLELSPAGVGVVAPATDGWLLHTNHFLDARLALHGTVPADSTSAERYAHLTEVRSTMPGLVPTERARALCGGARAGAAVCVHPDPNQPTHEQWGSLLTVSLDMVGCALTYATGDPDHAARAGFRRF